MERKINIFLVEDHYPDIVMMKKAFERNDLQVSMSMARDGEEAIAYLKRSETEQTVIMPDLIILDINLPKRSGYEVLQEVKNSARLSLIPVLILTSSKAEEDIRKSYQMQANTYMMKPESLKEYDAIVQGIKSFWLKVVND
ncbi:response regulator [Algivirga pacifica]|uniref:Response regulator n=1 Tax=Algivirga pacifica TaxID=1162670 RepID=A0ABP9DBA0_9BACT